MWAIRKVRHIVQSSNQFIVFVDHASIVGIVKSSSLTTSSTDKLNPRLVRAAQYLSLYDLDIRHWPGRYYHIPDAISRLPAESKPSETDILEDVFTYNVTTIELAPQFKHELKAAYRTDKFWSDKLALIAESGDEPRPGIPFILDNGLIYHIDDLDRLRRLVIPKALEGDVFALHHDHAGHAGRHRAYHDICSSYYIRNLSRRLQNYIDRCIPCQLNQTKRHKPYGKLQPIQTPPIPFHTLSFDLIVGLPEFEVNGIKYDALMTVTDHFTKAVELIPGRSDWTSEQWAEAMYPMFRRWGIPRATISDRDPKWLSTFFQAIFRRQGTVMLLTTAYHPQSDGQSERTNQTVEIAIRYHIAQSRQKNWVEILPDIAARLNNSINASTGKTLNKLIYSFRLN